MKNNSEITFGVRSHIPEEEVVKMLAKVEIRHSGYAVLLIRFPRMQKVMGVTLGLTDFGHAELTSSSGNEDDVFSLLDYLAQQVTEHGHIFEPGINSTSLFNDLTMRDVTESIFVGKLIPEVFDRPDMKWLHCIEPLDFASIQHQPGSQDFRRVA